MGDRVTGFKKAIESAYLHKIKKQMACPCCKEGKFAFIKKDNIWKCEMCGYELDDKLFTDDYIFWFCDECGAFMNNQEGFDYENDKNICSHCGYENDTSEANVKGVCSDCGKILDNPESRVCEECRQKRLKNAGKNMLKVVAGIAAIAAASYGVYKLINKEDAEKIINDIDINDLSIPSVDSNKTVEVATTDVTNAVTEKVVESVTSVAGDVVEKVVEAANDVADTVAEKVVYRTKTWNGYGKQNYYCNVYKKIGDEVVKYKEHTYKFFDGDENNWVNELTEIERWNINDPFMPEWLSERI